jgi:tetratricopeptide (TPR) repeat protein
MIGASYLNSLKYDTAIVYYKKAIEKNPSDANSYVNIGHSYYLNNQFTEAVPYYEQALKLDQSYTLPIPRLAYGYLLLKRYDEAINMYQKAIKQDTTMANQSIYYYNMACGTSLQKKTMDALSYFDKSLKTGYLDLKHFEEDTDLDNIRALPGFRKLIEEHFKKEDIDKYPKLFVGK